MKYQKINLGDKAIGLTELEFTLPLMFAKNLSEN